MACVLGATLSSPSVVLASTWSQPAAGEVLSTADDAGPGPEASESGKELARRRVAEGQALYEQAEYEAALVAFQDAAAAYASPDFQFNIGLCYERLGETMSAIRAFEAYLRNKPDARDKASVEHRISQLRAELERSSNPPTPPPPVVEPQALAEPADQSRSTAAESRPYKPLIIAGSVLTGVGATAMIAGGVGLGLLAQQRAERVDTVLDGSNPDELTRAETSAIAAQGDRFRSGQVGSLAGGGVVLVVGAALLTTGLRRKRQSNLSALPTGRGLTLTGSF